MPVKLPLLYGSPSLLDRLMEGTEWMAIPVSPDHTQSEFPPIQMVEQEDALYVRALVPSLCAHHVSVTVDSTFLRIVGVIPKVPGRYLKQDRMTGSFRREIPLPFAVQADSVEATLGNGVLAIRLPRVDSQAKRSIPVSATHE